MNWLKEFRDFALRGNVLDLAIAVIIGGAFGKITTSLVNDIGMPLLGMIVGRVNFSNLYLPLDGKSYPSVQVAREAGAPILAYGQFLNAVVDFLLVAVALFLVIKAINRFRRRQEVSAPPAPPPPSPEVALLTEIRDLLKNR